MTHDTPSLKRLTELEDQLSSLKKERDQLKQQIEADKIQAIQNVQQLLEKINEKLKSSQLKLKIDNELNLCLVKEDGSTARCVALSLSPNQLEKALLIIERHTKFIIAVANKFTLYRHVSTFSLDLNKQLLTFDILSDSYSCHFIYDTASETVSSHATAVRSRMNMSFVFGDVTMSVEGMDRTTVNYSLKTQTYTENLDRIPALYEQVKSSMLAVLSKLSL